MTTGWHVHLRGRPSHVKQTRIERMDVSRVVKTPEQLQPPSQQAICSRAVCAFPYLLAFTTDSMEIRLVVNGNLVHTAIVPQLQLVASRVSGMQRRSLSTPRCQVSRNCCLSHQDSCPGSEHQEGGGVSCLPSSRFQMLP